jgi:DNA-binding SARP family transcriptional activator
MNLVRLYLPLLANPEPAVRQQACLILLGTYGDRALTYLRRLVDDDDAQVRQDVRLALLSVEEVTGQGVKLHAFQGMYVECLGRLRIYVGNHEIQPQDWGQAERGRAGWQKVQATLAYLVHCGRRGASREALGTAAWGGAFSANSLARTLSVLRQALDRYADGSPTLKRALVAEGDYCLLDAECYHTDVQLFERAYVVATEVEHTHGLAQAATLYLQAVQLYAGPYMADVLGGNTWCRQRRDHLMSSFVIAAERLAEHAYAQQQYQRCIEICALALDADSAADDVVVWLMRAYAASGLRAELEHAYRNYLRSVGLDSHGAEERQDLVARAYGDLS